MPSRLVLALSIGLVAGLARAEAPAPGQVERALGAWELSNPAGDRKCGVTFRSGRSGRGFALAFEPACATLFPATAEIAAWTVEAGGNIVWLTREGRPAFDFGETEVGIFEALRPDDPTVYFLTSLSLAGTALPTAEEVTGVWSLAQPRGRPLCTVTFLAELAADAGPLDQRFALTLAEGCERSVAALRLASWRLERELLVVQGAGAALSFKREVDGRWVKTPADARPLVLTRQ